MALMTFEEFEAKLVAKFGEKGVRFREHGKHGWTSLDQLPEKLSFGNPGPHWCDASPIPATQRLLGTYNFNTKTAMFFVEL